MSSQLLLGEQVNWCAIQDLFHNVELFGRARPLRPTISIQLNSNWKCYTALDFGDRGIADVQGVQTRYSNL